MMTVQPMTEVDLDEIMPHIGDGLTWEQMYDRVLVWEGLHAAMRMDGELIACGGLTVFWSGVAEAWIQTTPRVRAHPLTFYRTAKGLLEDSLRLLKLHRVQALVREADDTGHRFMSHLGWTFEGCLHQGAPDRTDLYLYALVTKKEP